MLTYREATPEEFEKIAVLHANSWKTFYRNVFTDKYLDQDVLADRQTVWQSRSKIIDPKRSVLLAIEKDEIIGFACTFLDHSPIFGALLDNLHVSQNHQGKGIGLALIQKSFDWVKKNRPTQNLYLTVLTENHKSKAFYYRFGGNFMEEYVEKTPYGAPVSVERISWNQRPKLILK